MEPDVFIYSRFLTNIGLFWIGFALGRISVKKEKQK